VKGDAVAEGDRQDVQDARPGDDLPGSSDLLDLVSTTVS
jgi:hypothetical protein